MKNAGPAFRFRFSRIEDALKLLVESCRNDDGCESMALIAPHAAVVSTENILAFVIPSVCPRTTNRNQYVIYYNDIDRDITRIRWSIFHELGHISRGHHDNPDDSLYEIEEAEANLFAKYAIAPPPLIHVMKIRSWHEIVSVFQTSDDAARNCYNYYLKWLANGPEDYTDFELRLLELFHLSAA